jgi:hypothetical protein
MVKKLAVCVLATLLFAGLLLAHGNATHLMGTVTAVGKDTVTVQDKDGKSVVVTVEKTTKYFKNKKAATIADVTVGTRLVIDAQMDQKTKTYTAEEIQVGATDTSTSSAKTAPTKK